MQSKGVYEVYKMPINETTNIKRERGILNSIEDRL
jgi:hypothetical protein